MKNNHKILYIVLICTCLILAILLGIFLMNKEDVESDALKFSKEYGITSDNVFIYKSLDEINKILQNGTGIVYLGFPECPWCKEYVPYLNKVAKENNLDKIFYYNIFEDRKNNTSEYNITVELLKEYLQYDDEGNKRIYVPAVIAVNKGKIVGFDDETSYDTKGYATPSEYWENEDLDGLLNKLKNMIEEVKPTYCTTDCNK